MLDSVFNSRYLYGVGSRLDLIESTHSRLNRVIKAAKIEMSYQTKHGCAFVGAVELSQA